MKVNLKAFRIVMEAIKQIYLVRITLLKGVLCFFILLFFIPTLQAQTSKRSYEILLAGFQIGQMEVEEIIRGNTTEYNLQSNVSFWLFGKINVDLSIKSAYLDGKMISSESKSISNRGSFYSKIKWNGSSYIVDSNTYKFENKNPIAFQVPFATAKFYFQEPKHGQMMISETYGLASKLTEIEPNTYQININGNENKFFYKNGEMERALMENPIKNYVIKRLK